MADRPSEPFWIIAPESLLNSRSLEAAGNRHEGIGGMIEFQTDRLLVRDVRASAEHYRDTMGFRFAVTPLLL